MPGSRQSEFRYPDFHPGLDLAADTVEIHYVLRTDPWIVLRDKVKRISRLYGIDRVVRIGRYRGFVRRIRLLDCFLRGRCRHGAFTATIDYQPLSDTYIVAAKVVPPLDLAYAHPVAYGDFSEDFTASDPVDDSFSVAAVLDFLDDYRVEEFGSLVSIQRVFVVYESISICVRYAEDIFFFVAGNS